MRTVLLAALVSTLGGCSVYDCRDVDSGTAFVDSADASSASDVGGDDASVGGEDTGAETCAGVPLGPVTFNVTSSNCEGPFQLARSLSGVMRRTTNSCSLSGGSLRVICSGMYTELFINTALTRTGTTYISEETIMGCEGVTYICYARFDALSGERAVLCSLDIRRTWCTIALE